MRYANIITLPDVYSEEDGNYFCRAIFTSDYSNMLNKGIRLMNPKYDSAYNGEDFRYARKSWRYQAKGFRIPRIIKRHLQHKL